VSLSFVIAGLSRPKDGVLSHVYVPAFPIRNAKPCPPQRDGRNKSGHDRKKQ
jgi:hypothetical protein